MKNIKMVATFCVGFFLLGVGGVFAQQVMPKQAPVPADNKQTPEKIELGKKLFFDPRLSKTGTVSCNSCHNVMSDGSDGVATSTGIEGKKGGRNSPTVWNAAFLSAQFWDGRAPTLEEQAKGPLINPVEMGMKDHAAVIERVKKIPGYVAEFKKVFKSDDLTIDQLAQAIASYERTLITQNSPYDRFVKGDKKALSASAQKGMKLVQTVGCMSCHNGPLFAGPALTTGQPFLMKFPTIADTDYEDQYHLTEDKGRYEVTKKDSDKNMWRVQSWRNVAVTAPYFHNGSVKTLDEAVRVMAKTQLNRTLTPEEVADIVEFLKSLTGEFPKQQMPRLPDTAGLTLIGE